MADEKKYMSLNSCRDYPKFENLKWASAYKKCTMNMIKILDIYNNVSRLYVITQLDLSNNDVDVTINKLRDTKIIQCPDAVRLTSNLKDVLPNADPIYLDLVGEVYACNQDGLFEFLQEITKRKNTYPKINEYNEKVKIIKSINSLTTNFKVDEFVRMCPDPEKYFYSLKLNSDQLHYNESLTYLEKRFNQILDTDLLAIALQGFHYNLTKTVEFLKSGPTPRDENTRKRFNFKGGLDYYCYKNSENLEFWKEMAYLDHEEEILDYIKNEKSIYLEKVAEAKVNGKLRICECCYKDELLDSEVYCCPAGHSFCSSCIKLGTEVAVGGNKLEIKCFAVCHEELNLSIIKESIDDKLYQRILRLKQAEEIKAANIEGLESCAFCDFSIILPPDFKTINCLNPECKKETCRKCREESHFPLKCDEIEYSAEKKLISIVENKMSEVLMRTCYNCNDTFVKDGGCNIMTCICGEQMCYVCKQPIKFGDFSHFSVDFSLFSGDSAEDGNRCPIFMDDRVVISIATEAVARLKINELKTEQPELLNEIDINKIYILPDNSKINTNPNVLKLVAKLIGRNVHDINNLIDMSTHVSPQKYSISD